MTKMKKNLKKQASITTLLSLTVVILLALFFSCTFNPASQDSEETTLKETLMNQDPSVESKAVVKDYYEEDDSYSQAKTAYPLVWYYHDFGDDANDWMRFRATAGKTYNIQTWVDGSDTVLEVWVWEYSGGSNPPYVFKRVAINDDGGIGLGSFIKLRALYSWDYFVLCRSYAGRTGSNRLYTLMISEY